MRRGDGRQGRHAVLRRFRRRRRGSRALDERRRGERHRRCGCGGEGRLALRADERSRAVRLDLRRDARHAHRRPHAHFALRTVVAVVLLRGERPSGDLRVVEERVVARAAPALRERLVVEERAREARRVVELVGIAREVADALDEVDGAEEHDEDCARRSGSAGG